MIEIKANDPIDESIGIAHDCKQNVQLKEAFSYKWMCSMFESMLMLCVFVGIQFFFCIPIKMIIFRKVFCHLNKSQWLCSYTSIIIPVIWILYYLKWQSMCHCFVLSFLCHFGCKSTLYSTHSEWQRVSLCGFNSGYNFENGTTIWWKHSRMR